jgi:arylsulfatase A
MLRRKFLAALSGAALQAAGRPINIVLILADDLGARDLGCYGNRFVSTPHLDRLAAEGARFTNAYAACPVCSPTRASVLTGRYPVRTGVTDWIPGRPHHDRGPLETPRTARQLSLGEITLAERLKQAGYRSASVGKWHLGGEGFSPLEQGFDLNVGGNHTGSPPPGPRAYFGPFDLPNLKAGGGEFLTEKLTEAACRFIEQNRRNPFFLYLPHYTVHTPISARARDAERHREKAGGRYNPVYAAMIESLDESVGAILDTLDKTGLAKDTLVVFTSDNGGLRFEGTAPKPVTDNSPLRAGKGHLYEGGIRVPLLMRLPARVRRSAVIDTAVASIDHFPTVCQFAGVAPGRVDGASLEPLLRGAKLKARPLFWHYPHYSNQGGEPGSAIREGDWKLIEFHTDGRREFFNLREDERETRNLVELEPDLARKLGAKLEAWRNECGAAMPRRNVNADPAWPGWRLTGEEKPAPPARNR